MTTDRDPEWDLFLFGAAYGERQDDGTIRWIDPTKIVVLRRGEVHVD